MNLETHSIINIADYIAVHARERPDQIALWMPKGRWNIFRIRKTKKTFRELHNEIEGLVYTLREIFHILPQQRVLLVVRPGYELIVSAFALMRLGAIPIVIDSGMGLRRFFICARKSKPDFILGTGSLRWRLAGLKPFLLPHVQAIWLTRSFQKQWQQHILPSDWPLDDPLLSSIQAGDPAAILFTSGSTGPAKGVLYRHRHFMAQLEALKKHYPLHADDVDLPLLPIFSLFNPILGRTTVLPEMDATMPSRLRPKKIVKALQRHSVTSSFGAPVLWRKIALYCRQQGIQLPDIRFLFLAGVSCDIPTLELLRSIAPNADIHTPYGATEALPISDIRGAEILNRWKVLQENGAGICVGQPISDVHIRIIQATEEAIPQWNSSLELPTGHVGEIIVSGPMVTEAYDQETEKTRMAKIMEDETVWHRMGDVGFLDQQGRLWLCGRKAERVMVHDEIFYPDCIEAFFLKHPHVTRCALIRIIRQKHILPAIVIQPKLGHYPFWSLSRRRFVEELKKWAERFEKTRSIQDFFFCRKLPVDVRHNAKIHRIALGRKFS